MPPYLDPSFAVNFAPPYSLCITRVCVFVLVASAYIYMCSPFSIPPLRTPLQLRRVFYGMVPRSELDQRLAAAHREVLLSP